MCSDKDDDLTKSMWLSFVSDLKLHEQGDIGSPNFMKGLSSSSGGMYNLSENEQNDIVSLSKDGQWVVVKKWSECSKTCGGGVSVLQRMCLPPKPGGRPC